MINELIMYCKDCKYRKEYVCTNEHLIEYELQDPSKWFEESGGNRLVYSYDEGGYFQVEDYFGCVHFEEKD